MAKKKSQKLSIFLLNRKIKSYKGYLKTTRVESFKLNPELLLKGEIFVGETSTSPPDWVEFLDQGTKKMLPAGIMNTSNKAILFVEYLNRVYAITFGYGRYLLEEDYIERNFGLKVVLNSVNPDKLKSIDLANVENLAIKTRKQNSQGGSRQVFGLDVINDLMKAVTGTPLNRVLGGVLNGRDQINLSPKIEFIDLKNIIKIIDKNYDSDVYKSHFEWIDNIYIEKDISVINKLNDLLLVEIKNSNSKDIFLTIPEVIDWELSYQFTYTPKGVLSDELEINDFYIKVNDDLDKLDLDKLKSHRVYAHFGDNVDSIPKWSVYKCLNFEVVMNGNRYSLANGTWYKVKEIFANEVLEYVKQIPIYSRSLIDHYDGDTEGEYNERLADSDASVYSLMDKKNVYCALARSSIEPCDVFTKDKHFIHVKKKSSSSTLSHLFAQGRISGEAFISDREFRKGARKNLTKENRLDPELIPLSHKIKSAEYEVVYAFISSSSKDLVESLPFFSLLNLKQSFHSLNKMMGYNVSICRISVSPNPNPKIKKRSPKKTNSKVKPKIKKNTKSVIKKRLALKEPPISKF